MNPANGDVESTLAAAVNALLLSRNPGFQTSSQTAAPFTGMLQPYKSTDALEEPRFHQSGHDRTISVRSMVSKCLNPNCRPARKPNEMM